jgi:hypothetical protein
MTNAERTKAEADSSAALRNDKQSDYGMTNKRCYGMTNAERTKAEADSSAALRNDKQKTLRNDKQSDYGMTNKATTE